MSSARLLWAVDGRGIRLQCQGESRTIPYDQWATQPGLTTLDAVSVRLAPVFALVDSGAADADTDGTVWLPAESVASLQPNDLAGLGLPSAAPFALRLEKVGLLSDQKFTVHAALVKPGGQPVLGAQLEGPFVRVGDRRYTLLNPVFHVLNTVDTLNAAADFESRGPHLQELQRWLPDDALADEYLKFIQIARADSFTMLPRLNDAGEVDFDVRPARTTNIADEVSPRLEYSGALPEAREKEWNRQFRHASNVRQTYATGSGHYLVVADALREALTVVKKLQNSSATTRAAFVRNPRAFIRDNLGDLIPDGTLESVFWESGEYGQRVRDVGLWQPKVLPFVRKSGKQWLPPEDMGLRIADQMVRVAPEDAERLLQDLQNANEQGRASVEYAGHQIPASDDAIASVRELVGAVQPLGATLEDSDRQRQSYEGRIAVLIADNLESLDFERTGRPRPGVVGALPGTLSTALFPFQHEGLRWLQTLWTAGASGALLADDMGLGKTVQTLAFLAWVGELQEAQAIERRPHLIVGPTGLLRNWIAEHELHLMGGGLGSLFEAHGHAIRNLRRSGTRSSELDAGIPVLDVDELARQDCVLTTYETLRDYQHSFTKIRWGVVVLDEAQKVKNPAALVTESVKALEGEFTIALTGTPVENHLADLWCITDTVQPGRLGALKDFVKFYQGEENAETDRLRDLKALLTERHPPAMLRRMKDAHLRGLPTIHHEVTRAEMPPRQAEAYEKVVAQARSQDADRGAMLKTLQHLRSVSLHPDSTFAGDHRSFIVASARLIECFKVLDAIASAGEKALVFLEALALQGVLAELIQRRYDLPSPPLIINGSVEGSKRKSRVDVFQARSGFDVMILSPRAAGIGLNITEANHVIHLSRWWNPAVEDQATDRVYRIGQSRPVHVHTPLAVHPRFGDASFDVQLHDLLSKKRELSRQVLAPTVVSESELASLYKGTVQ